MASTTTATATVLLMLKLLIHYLLLLGHDGDDRDDHAQDDQHDAAQNKLHLQIYIHGYIIYTYAERVSSDGVYRNYVARAYTIIYIYMCVNEQMCQSCVP